MSSMPELVITHAALGPATYLVVEEDQVIRQVAKGPGILVDLLDLAVQNEQLQVGELCFQ